MRAAECVVLNDYYVANATQLVLRSRHNNQRRRLRRKLKGEHTIVTNRKLKANINLTVRLGLKL